MPEEKKDEKDWGKIYSAEAPAATDTDAPEDTDAPGAQKAAASEESTEQPPQQEVTSAAADTVGGVLDHPSYKGLQAKLDEAEAKVHKNWDKAVRAMAEVDNVRRRLERDLANAHKYSTEKLFIALLPVADSLEQALQQEDSGEGTAGGNGSLHEGLLLTLKLLLDSFAKFSLTQIDPKGEKFDPNLHEAMSMQSDSDAEAGTILAVIQKGYQLHTRVIRPARVIVAASNT